MQSADALNAIEIALIDAHSGNMPPSKLFEALHASKVFVLINKEVGPGAAWDDDTALLVLNSQSGMPVVAVFTAPERASAWSAQAPDFNFRLPVDFRWLLHGIAENLGMVLNPGSVVGLELTPAILQKLRDSASSTAS